MRRVRFWEVDGEDVNADGGFIEVDDDGLVTMSKHLDWVADLPAPLSVGWGKGDATIPLSAGLWGQLE